MDKRCNMAKITHTQIEQTLTSINHPNQALAHLLNAIATEMSLPPQQLLTNLKLSAQQNQPLFFLDALDYEEFNWLQNLPTSEPDA